MIDIRKQQSAFDLIYTVWPVIKREIGGGNIVSTETDDNEVCRILDLQAGTDAIGNIGGHIFLIASRIHRTGKAKNLFTVRKSCPSKRPTEYDKLQAAQQFGSAYAGIHIEAYLTEDAQDVLSVAIIRTNILLDAVTNYGIDKRWLDGTTFRIISWNYLKYTLKTPIRLWTWEKTTKQVA